MSTISGWTILTVRGRPSKDYDGSEYDGGDPWQANADLVATMKADDRVRRVTTWIGHVYAYLNCPRYDFEFAEELMEDYAPMVRDFVVLGANDTSDTGHAKYYPGPGRRPNDEYQESQKEDGTMVGEIALAHVSANNGIIARDPFHQSCGRMDDYYEDDGNVRKNSLKSETEE